MMKKALIGFAIALGILGMVASAGVMYIGAMGPEIFVQYGYEVKDRFRDTIEELGLLEEGEELNYFYSDGIVSIRNGMYMLTDRHLILYDDSWETPAVILPFSRLQAVGAEFSDSFFVDSYLSVVDDEDNYWIFPVSKGKGRDHEFHDYLEARIEEEGFYSE